MVRSAYVALYKAFMNINEAGRQPHGWHGLEDNRWIKRDTPTEGYKVVMRGARWGQGGYEGYEVGMRWVQGGYKGYKVGMRGMRWV